MKKLLIITIIAFNALSIFAQTQKFDIMTFTPPKGWKAEANNNAKIFTKIDKSTNSLGIIMLYPSIDSSGDANDDFKYVWKQIVQNGFGASANPETETAQDKGFTVINGGELIKYEGIQALAMLTVLSGKGKVISILTITNEQSYANVTQSLIDGMAIDARDSPKPSKQPTGNESMSASSLKKELLGEWYLSDGNIKIALAFAVNGRFGRSFTSESAKPIALNLYQTTTWQGNGTYTLNGNTLKLYPKSGSAETYQIRVAFEKNSDGKLEKKLYLVRPVEGGNLYESEYWFVK